MCVRYDDADYDTESDIWYGHRPVQLRAVGGVLGDLVPTAALQQRPYGDHRTFSASTYKAYMERALDRKRGPIGSAPLFIPHNDNDGNDHDRICSALPDGGPPVAVPSLPCGDIEVLEEELDAAFPMSDDNENTAEVASTSASSAATLFPQYYLRRHTQDGTPKTSVLSATDASLFVAPLIKQPLSSFPSSASAFSQALVDAAASRRVDAPTHCGSEGSEGGKGYICGVASGVRSALVSSSALAAAHRIPTAALGRKPQWYRLKGCGNNDGPFRIIQRLDNTQLQVSPQQTASPCSASASSTVDDRTVREIRGCAFFHTAVRELVMTRMVQERINTFGDGRGRHNEASRPDEAIEGGNKAVGMWLYDEQNKAENHLADCGDDGLVSDARKAAADGIPCLAPHFGLLNDTRERTTPASEAREEQAEKQQHHSRGPKIPSGSGQARSTYRSHLRTACIIHSTLGDRRLGTHILGGLDSGVLPIILQYDEDKDAAENEGGNNSTEDGSLQELFGAKLSRWKHQLFFDNKEGKPRPKTAMRDTHVLEPEVENEQLSTRPDPHTVTTSMLFLDMMLAFETKECTIAYPSSYTECDQDTTRMKSPSRPQTPPQYGGLEWPDVRRDETTLCVLFPISTTSFKPRSPPDTMIAEPTIKPSAAAADASRLQNHWCPSASPVSGIHLIVPSNALLGDIGEKMYPMQWTKQGALPMNSSDSLWCRRWDQFCDQFRSDLVQASPPSSSHPPSPNPRLPCVGMSGLIYLYNRLGFECGRFLACLHRCGVSWGTYEEKRDYDDHDADLSAAGCGDSGDEHVLDSEGGGAGGGSYGLWHCNAHSNNMVVLDPHRHQHHHIAAEKCVHPACDNEQLHRDHPLSSDRPSLHVPSPASTPNSFFNLLGYVDLDMAYDCASYAEFRTYCKSRHRRCRRRCSHSRSNTVEAAEASGVETKTMIASNHPDGHTSSDTSSATSNHDQRAVRTQVQGCSSYYDYACVFDKEIRQREYVNFAEVLAGGDTSTGVPRPPIAYHSADVFPPNAPFLPLEALRCPCCGDRSPADSQAYTYRRDGDNKPRDEAVHKSETQSDATCEATMRNKSNPSWTQCYQNYQRDRHMLVRNALNDTMMVCFTRAYEYYYYYHRFTGLRDHDDSGHIDRKIYDYEYFFKEALLLEVHEVRMYPPLSPSQSSESDENSEQRQRLRERMRYHQIALMLMRLAVIVTADFLA